MAEVRHEHRAGANSFA
jgi:hypothetical protein